MGRLIGAFVGMLLALASPVSAKLVTYDLQGAVFQGGERAGGFITIDTESPPPFENANQSFVFDYMIDVEATQDGTFSSFTYAPALAVDYSIYFNQPPFGEVFVLQIVSPQTNRVLELWFDETPLSFDGLRSLDLIAGEGGNYSGDRENGPIRNIVAGTLVPRQAVPEPAVWAMMIMGFGLVGGGSRWRTRLRIGARASANRGTTC